MSIVIIHGSGKTRRAQQLMQHYGCQRVVDEWDGASPLNDGDLALTNTPPPFAVPGAIVVDADSINKSDIEHTFKREHRYHVVKIADAKKYLTGTEQAIFAELLCKVTALRASSGNPPMKCVVVEHDWPEYEPTWAAIERRVKRETCNHEWTLHPVAGDGEICRSCGAHRLCDD